MKQNLQIVGNAGLYYACYKLSCLGWNVMPTARNARGIDVIAYNADCSKLVGIQVKSLSKRNPVPLGPSIDNIMGNFWIIVIDVSSEPKSFIMTPAEVRKLAHKGIKDDKISYWLQPKSYDNEEYSEAWERVC